MMRLVNDLEVVGGDSEIAELIRRLEARPDDRWRREREPVERLRKMLSVPAEAPKSSFCFSIGDKPGWPGATIWFERKRPDRMAVSHIVADKRQALTDDEYNTILGDFDASVLQPLIEDLSVDLRIVPPLVRLEESIPRDAMESLRSFSQAALSSGLEDPDRNAWGHFLIQIHRDGWVLDGGDLDWWLGQKGWPEESRARLVKRYREGLSLLARYDEERVPS